MIPINIISEKTAKRFWRLAFFGFALAVAIAFDLLSWGVKLGLWFPIFVTFYLVGFLFITGKTGHLVQKWPLFLIIPIMLLSVSTTLYNNDLIQFAPAIVITLLLFFSITITLRNPHKQFFLVRRIAIIQDWDVKWLPFRKMWNDLTKKKEKKMGEVYKKIAIGIIVAIPFLLIFGILFAKADTIFASWLNNFMSLNLDTDMVYRQFRVLLITLVVATLFYIFIDQRHSLKATIVRSKRTDKIVISTVLVLVNVLFLLFVVFQVKYMFGTQNFVLENGLTFAEYARKGFFELFFVTLVAAGLVMVVYHTLEGKEKLFPLLTVLKILLIIQVAVVAMSALKRMNIYQDAYGFTVLRLYVEWFIYLILAILVTWMVCLFSRVSFRGMFYTTLAIGLMALSVISLINVDGMIAKKNVDRHINDGKELDVGYLLVDLSVDVIPEVKRAIFHHQGELAFEPVYSQYNKWQEFKVIMREETGEYYKTGVRRSTQSVAQILIEREKRERSDWRSFNYILNREHFE